MEKPCGEECADEDSVFHNGVAQPERFGVLEHPLQGFDDIRRVKLLKAVVDVALAAILRAIHIVLHPLLQCLDAVGVPSAGNACDAVPVHAPHNVRDHRLHNSVVNILVRPQKRLVDVSPFAFAAVRVAVPAPSLEGRVQLCPVGFSSASAVRSTVRYRKGEEPLLPNGGLACGLARMRQPMLSFEFDVLL